jgi:hypothetical protein
MSMLADVSRARMLAFAAVCAGCVLVGGAMVARATIRERTLAIPLAARGTTIEAGMLVFTHPEQRGVVMVARTETPTQAWALPLHCDRVHFAGKRGICLRDTRERIYPPAIAIVFDERAREVGRFDLAGVPSRARVSPGGRYAAATVFVQGDSYDSPLGMSTRTVVFDLQDNKLLGDLEQFAVAGARRPDRGSERNFWGVTFVGDTGAFYATLGAGSETYLLAGDVHTRALRILRPHVECPSLSPDGQSIAYKHRNADGTWRLHVLDVATLRDRALGELRNYDDQTEWLDAHTVVYGHHEQRVDGSGGSPVNIWGLSLDANASPRLLVRGGWSPAVVR